MAGISIVANRFDQPGCFAKIRPSRCLADYPFIW